MFFGESETDCISLDSVYQDIFIGGVFDSVITVRGATREYRDFFVFFFLIGFIPKPFVMLMAGVFA